ncbi:MFS transporter [Variovorax sp. J22P271]|uniref:MFS transporter n=1 Tax=Variovorax davisae TaxID=3053515 RepID=UPI002577506D|nr:MFS transporter [Variovorax sp. J22P271]MDM0032237.1 MFS transporter [Variovorax sp. J22P271]
MLVAFALSLGAGPLTIGLLAAIPFAVQAAQLPTIFLVERLRQRKKISVTAPTTARIIIFFLAFLPFAPQGVRLPLLVVSQLLIGLLGAVVACAVNSWFHQLLPVASLGKFFGRRLLAASLMACASTLVAGFLVDHPPFQVSNYAFAMAFAGAGIAGMISTLFLARTPEPVMHSGARKIPLRKMLDEPLRDPNFRSLLFVLGSWNLASNLVAPFITVYLLQQLGYSLSTVTALWVTSQLANAAALFLWGELSDRLSNKAILAVALPAYFVGTLGLVFADLGHSARFELFLLYLLHVVMGFASGGIGLATGNLGLKLAPQHRGTSYLAVIGLVAAVAGGIAPIAGGAIAQYFTYSELTVVMRWLSPARTNEVALLSFAHWEFLFALSAVMGMYVMHALSRVREGDEISERVVVQELALEALRTVNHLSSLGGVLGGVFSFARISKWRRDSRRGGPSRQA